MADPSSGAPLPPAPASDERLNSWKEIAAYLRRDVTTVQRWEKREGMPVHRHVHDKLGSVYAFRSELDGWTRRRNLPPPSEDVPAGAAPDLPDTSPADDEPRPSSLSERAPRDRRRSMVAWTAGVATVLLVLLAVWWRLDRAEVFWSDPVQRAHFRNLTDLAGADRAAAISRD